MITTNGTMSYLGAFRHFKSQGHGDDFAALLADKHTSLVPSAAAVKAAVAKCEADGLAHVTVPMYVIGGSAWGWDGSEEVYTVEGVVCTDRNDAWMISHDIAKHVSGGRTCYAYVEADGEWSVFID